MSDFKPRRGARESGSGKVVRLAPATVSPAIPAAISGSITDMAPIPAVIAAPPVMPTEAPAPAFPAEIPASDEAAPVQAIETAVAQTIRAAAAPLPPTPPAAAVFPLPAPVAPPVAPRRTEGWGALLAAQSALVRGYQQMWGELSGLTRSGIAASSEAAVALLTAKTLSDAMQINTELARKNFDAAVEGSAKLSEIGVKALSAASRPLLTSFGR